MVAGPIILVFLSAFDVDQVIELEKYLNGRTSESFLKSSNNIKSTLPPGTRGKIVQIKKFNSGNYGYKILVQNGKEKGNELWVYYRTEDPGITLYSDEQGKKETQKPDEAKAAKLVRKQAALRETSSETTVSIEESLEKINEGNKKLQKIAQPCSDCEVRKVHQTAVESGPEGPPTKVVQDNPLLDPIVTTLNPLHNPSTRCRSLDSLNVCMAEGDTQVSQFTLRNTIQEGRFREYTFHREGQARQDLGLFITDSPNGSNSQSQESLLMFFPRKTLPTAKKSGSNMVMTLPNGETVTYDANNKVIKGVLAENGPMGRNPAKVSYKGEGVMLRANSVGTDARKGGQKVTITKGKATCQVSKKELWPDQSESSSFKFVYADDGGFNKFLQSRCGFGL